MEANYVKFRAAFLKCYEPNERKNLQNYIRSKYTLLCNGAKGVRICDNAFSAWWDAKRG